MKSSIHAALAAALLAPGLWTVSARAQDDAPPPAEHSEQRRPDGDMAARMTKRLGLTDEQSAKLKDAMKAHRDALRQQGQAVKDAVKKLADDLKAKAADDELLAALASLKTTRKAMAEENDQFEETLASFLTPTQRAKMAVGMAMMMRDRRGGFRGGKSEEDHRDGDRRGDGDRDDDGQ